MTLLELTLKLQQFIADNPEMADAEVYKQIEYDQSGCYNIDGILDFGVADQEGFIYNEEGLDLVLS